MGIQEELLQRKQETENVSQSLETRRQELAPPEKKGFVERTEQRLEGRKAEVGKSALDLIQGDIGPSQAAIQIIGKGVAGSALDIVGEGITSAGRGLSFIIPDSIEEPAKQAIVKGWKILTETDLGKAAGEALKGGVEQWNEFKQENPQTAKTIESSVNIGLILAPAKTKAHAKPTVLAKTSKKIGKVTAKQISAKRSQFVGELIRPKSTPAIRLEETARTKEIGRGLFKRSVVELSPRQKEIMTEVKRIKGVSKKNTVQGNLNVVNNANVNLNKKLARDVGKSRATITFDEARQAIDDAVTELIESNPLITGIPEKTARKFADSAIEIISKQPSTPLGILKARKQFDKLIRRQKGQAFDPKFENITSVTTRKIRNAMNDLVDSSVNTTAVKKELKKSSLLFDAIDNIGPKAADEANFAIGRAVQNMAKVLPFRSKFVQEAGTIVGLGIVGASSTFAPVFAGGLAATVATVTGGRLLLGPGMKKSLGKIIKGLDRAIFTSKSPSMIKQLRLDRALIVELIKNAEEEKE